MQLYKNNLITAEPFNKAEQTFEGNLFIKNLSSDTTAKEVYDLFSKYGEVKSIKMKNNEKGESLGYCYVNFEDKASAQDAIDNLNGKEEYKGKKLLVEFYEKKEKVKEEIKNPAVIIKQLPESVNIII
jgi:RNA recognition motif-containing protein